MFKRLFGKPKHGSTDIKPHGQTDALMTIEKLDEVSFHPQGTHPIPIPHLLKLPSQSKTSFSFVCIVLASISIRFAPI